MNYHVYLDESGTHKGSELLTLAGYVFEERQARLFSRDWAIELSRFGLRFAHMTDCAVGQGEYKKLSLKHRVDSEKALIRLIKKRSLVGIAVSVDEQAFQRAMYGSPYPHSAYTLLLLIAVDKIAKYVKQIRPEAQISYFFESGHAKSKEANEYMAAVPVLGLREEYGYWRHAFVNKTSALPLQAADMLAWQHRHYHVRCLKGHYKVRADYAALMRDDDFESVIEDRHLLALRKMYSIVGTHPGLANVPSLMSELDMLGL